MPVMPIKNRAISVASRCNHAESKPDGTSVLVIRIDGHTEEQQAVGGVDKRCNVGEHYTLDRPAHLDRRSECQFSFSCRKKSSEGGPCLHAFCPKPSPVFSLIVTSQPRTSLARPGTQLAGCLPRARKRSTQPRASSQKATKRAVNCSRVVSCEVQRV